MKYQDEVSTLNTSMTRLKRGLGRLKYLISSSLPNRCLLCQQLIEQYGYAHFCAEHRLTGVCQTCLVQGLYQVDVCLGCSKPMQISQAFCGQCQAISPLKVITPCSYHQGLAPLIAGIKYQQQFAPLQALITTLVMRIKRLVAQELIVLPQVLIPVPLHPSRLQQRGFNQALLIANGIGERLGITVDSTCVTKVIDTPPQAGLDGKTRRENNQRAFALQSEVRFARAAIIDDVITTGTTTDCIAQLLLKQGVHCQIWCLARAEDPRIRMALQQAV